MKKPAKKTAPKKEEKKQDLPEATKVIERPEKPKQTAFTGTLSGLRMS